MRFSTAAIDPNVFGITIFLLLMRCVSLWAQQASICMTFCRISCLASMSLCAFQHSGHRSKCLCKIKYVFWCCVFCDVRFFLPCNMSAAMRSMPSTSLSKRTQQLERTLQPPMLQRRGLDLFVFVTPGLFLDWVGVRRRLQCLACF